MFRCLATSRPLSQALGIALSALSNLTQGFRMSRKARKSCTRTPSTLQPEKYDQRCCHGNTPRCKITTKLRRAEGKMSDDGSWFSKYNIDVPQRQLDADGNHWRDTNAEFLLHSDTLKQDGWGISTKHRMIDDIPVRRNHSLNKLPKEERMTNARRLAREEKFQQLSATKQGNLIDREIRLLKDSLNNSRFLQKLQLENVEGSSPVRRSQLRQITQCNLRSKIGNSKFDCLHEGNFLEDCLEASGKLKDLKTIQKSFGLKIKEKEVSNADDHENCESYPTSTKAKADLTVVLEDFLSDNNSTPDTVIVNSDELLSEPNSEIMRIDEENDNVDGNVIKIMQADNREEKRERMDQSKSEKYANMIETFRECSTLRIKRFYWSKWRLRVKTIKTIIAEERKWQEKIDNFISGLSDYSNQTAVANKSAADKKYRRKTAPLVKITNDQSSTNNEDLEAISNAIEESTATTRHLLRPKSVQKIEPALRGRARLIRIISTTMSNVTEEPKLMAEFPPPPILEEMNKKHLERKQRVQDILYKKRLIEEEKDRLAKEKYERQLLDVLLEKKRKIEAFREKMRKQRIAQEKQKEEWARIQRLTAQSMHFYRTNLLTKYGFKPWLDLVKVRRSQNELAVHQNDRRIQRKTLLEWKSNIAEIFIAKERIADTFREKLLLKNTFHRWKQACCDVRLLFQVADDWYDQLLTQLTFRAWQDYVFFQAYYYESKMREAIAHHKKKELTKHLKQWMLMPQVMYLEREKESRKQELRKKVQQVLPDFAPPPSSNTLRYS